MEFERSIDMDKFGKPDKKLRRIPDI